MKQRTRSEPLALEGDTVAAVVRSSSGGEEDKSAAAPGRGTPLHHRKWMHGGERSLRKRAALTEEGVLAEASAVRGRRSCRRAPRDALSA